MLSCFAESTDGALPVCVLSQVCSSAMRGLPTGRIATFGAAATASTVTPDSAAARSRASFAIPRTSQVPRE